MDRTRNILFVGLGGQGILKASEICAVTLFRHGVDVKQSEVHGMSQRGGSVTSEVRFGREVHSPLIPRGAVDYLVAMQAEEGERNRDQLRGNGRFLTIADCLETAIGPNVMANTVIATPSRFSHWAVLGEPLKATMIYLPIVLRNH